MSSPIENSQWVYVVVQGPGGNPQLLGQNDKKAAAAFGRGVECILKCQIVIGGKPTVWCAQHDEVTFAPAKARDYVLRLEELAGAPVSCIGVGPGREQAIVRRDVLAPR